MASGMKYAIAQSSSSRDISALRQDLHNCPCHCFGDHRRCRPYICNHAGEGDKVRKNHMSTLNQEFIIFVWGEYLTGVN